MTDSLQQTAEAMRARGMPEGTLRNALRAMRSQGWTDEMMLEVFNPAAAAAKRLQDRRRAKEERAAARAASLENRREAKRRRRVLERTSSRRALNPLTPQEKRKRFALFDDRCAYCGGVYRLTVDHVLPLNLGGLDEAVNIIPACHWCNSSKNASLVEEWYKRQPFFTEARWQRIQHHTKPF